VKDSPDKDDKNDNYDKIKHLVEVDDDILAVFSIESSLMKELYIAQSADIDEKYVKSLIHILELKKTLDCEEPQSRECNNLLAKLKWVVMEYEKIRILKIFEDDKTIFVLIKSNTQLEHTVDNILGYYYDLDEIPRSLF